MSPFHFRRCAGVCVGLFLTSFLWAQAPDSGSHYKPFDPGASYQSARSRPFHVEHYKLELSFDQPKAELRGIDTITLAPFNDDFRTVELDSSDLTIDKVIDGAGTALAFRVEPDKLFIDLHRPAARGDRVQVAITYHGHPTNGMNFINPDKSYPNLAPEMWTQGESEFNHYWFPCYDFPNDKATSEVIVTVPEDEKVISNGSLVSATENKAAHTKTYHWKESVPHSSYLTSLVVGPFTPFEARYKNIPVEYYVAPGVDQATTERSFGLTPDMMAFFSTITRQEYPYEKYAQSAVERYRGGMENISATTQTDQTLHDERAEQDYPSLGLVAHELAHQWFGDLLTCASWSDIWLNEGFASFFESLYREHHLGHEEYREHMRDFENSYFATDRRYRRSIVEHRYSDNAHLFDATTYQKGARVLDMLRDVLGDPLFFAGMQHYVAANRAKNVVTFDFEKALEEVSGRNLDWFFNEWVYHSGHPELKVTAQWNAPRKVEQVHVEQVQFVDVTTLLFRMPVKIEIRTAGGTKTFEVELNGKSQDYFFTLDSQPLMVLFDPGDHLLKTIDFPKTTSELAYQVKEATEGQDRLWAAQQLGKQGAEPGVIATLKTALQSDSFYAVRAAAAKALGELRSPEAFDALSLVVQDKNSHVRVAGAEALGSFVKNEKAASIVSALLEQDDSYATQAAAAESLAKIKAPGAFEALKKKLASRPYRTVASGIYSAFNILKDKNAIPLALADSAYGRPDVLRMAAVGTLGRLGQDNKEALQRLLEIADDPNTFMRAQAIDALGELGNPEALAKLEEITGRGGRGGRFGNAGDADAASAAIERIRSAGGSQKEAAKLQSQIDDLHRENQRLEREVEELKKRGR